MIQSMTGFGRGAEASESKKITVEIKSLNSKQLDLAMRVPSYFREMEVTMRNELSRLLQRGKVEMTVYVENLVPEASASVNVGVLKVYKSQLEAMGAELGIGAPADWYGTLLRLPDAMRQESHQMGEGDEAAFRTAALEAVAHLTESRRREGERLLGFFEQKTERIGALLEEIAPYEAERVPRIKARLEQELARLNGIEYEPGRLEQELIFYIEKLDVTEEKVRLRTHLNYFLETLRLDSATGQGKQLGFIAQEIGREINTLGSKSNHAAMQRIVVMMKDELEQIKEQVLNVL